jgi:hypothetical protein
MNIQMLLVAAMIAAPATLLLDSDAALACPPGLAKKDPPCVPPGQARHAANLVYLDDYARYSLPALPSYQRYAVVDDQIVVIDRDTYEVLQFIRAFAALTD